jgi:nucleotide-binding universal stress UspA family protein
MNVRRILCPTDFSEPSAHALEQATRLAGSFRARLTVLHVRPTVTPHPDMPADGPVAPWLVAELNELRQRVTASCSEAAGGGMAAEPMVAAGDPVREIVRYATTLPADLVVMGTHGVSGFRHLVLGSITEKVLRTAPCPVLTVPPRTQTTASQFTRVVCAVDFSECSLAAVNLAASVAAVSGAALTLLHVLEWPWHDTAAAALEGVSPGGAKPSMTTGVTSRAGRKNASTPSPRRPCPRLRWRRRSGSVSRMSSCSTRRGRRGRT